MTDPDADNRSNSGTETEKSAIDNSVNVPIDDVEESKAHLINSNGGARDLPEVSVVDRTDRSSDQASFCGLGKDEVMQYANDPFWVRLRWVLFILFWVGWLAMLATAIIIIAVAPRCPPRPDLKWYQKETVYQAYSKSFKDSNKDGFGDFAGLKDKFDYITDLGAQAIYLNAIFKTDQSLGNSVERDMAIIDHKDLDEKFGTTVEKFRSWMKNLGKKDQKVILDFIPNHTSKKHEWFMKSAAGDEDYKSYYIWGGTPGNKPNDAKTATGDSAWEFEVKRNEWYYHSYSKDLPDLNLTNIAVQKELKDILKFWFSAGVGGFNIKDLDVLVETESPSVEHDHDGTVAFLKELRTIADNYSDKPGRERFLFANVGADKDQNQTSSYWGDKDGRGLHLVLPTMKFGQKCDATCMSSWIGSLPSGKKQWLGLQLGNEDTSRIGSRAPTGSPKSFVNIAQAVQMLLPGSPFTYYGDEFGQKDGAESSLANNKFNPLNARTPMQWSDEANAGFAEPGVSPWLAVGPNYKSDNLRASRSHYNDHSILHTFKKLIELRGRESFQWGKTKACVVNSDVLLFTRKAYRFPYFLVLVNMGENSNRAYLPSMKCVESKETGKVIFHSRDEVIGDVLDLKHAISLDVGDIVVIEFAADD